MRFTAFLETRLNPGTKDIGDLEGLRKSDSSGGWRGLGDTSRGMR